MSINTEFTSSSKTTAYTGPGEHELAAQVSPCGREAVSSSQAGHSPLRQGAPQAGADFKAHSPVADYT